MILRFGRSRGASTPIKRLLQGNFSGNRIDRQSPTHRYGRRPRTVRCFLKSPQIPFGNFGPVH